LAQFGPHRSLHCATGPDQDFRFSARLIVKASKSIF